MTTCSPHSEPQSRFDLINQLCAAARSDTSSKWEQQREERISQAQAEMDRMQTNLSRKRRDFSKPNSGEPVRAEARVQERRVRAEAVKSQTTPVIKTGRPGRPRKTLYAWGDSPKH